MGRGVAIAIISIIRGRAATATQASAAADKVVDMAKLVFGMNQSLDGYVDHMAFAPSPTLFRHFIEEARGAGRQCVRSPDV